MNEQESIEEVSELTPLRGPNVHLPFASARFIHSVDQAPRSAEPREDTRSVYNEIKDSDMEISIEIPTIDAVSISSNYLSLRPKDRFFAILFYICQSMLFIMGCGTMLVSPSTNPIKDLFTSNIDSLYRAISSNLSAFFLGVFASCMIGFIWLYLLQYHANILVWSILWFIPLICGCLFFASLVQAILYSAVWSDLDNPISISLLLAFAIFNLSLFLLFIHSIRRRKERITVTVEAIQTACRILQQNPGIILASFGIFVCYILYGCLWLTMFMSLLTIGAPDANDPTKIPHPIFHLYTKSYFMQGYFVFMFFWTSALFANVQKSMVAYIVINVCRHESSQLSLTDPENMQRLGLFSKHPKSSTLVYEGLEHALTTFMGTNSLGGLFFIFPFRWIMSILGFFSATSSISRPSRHASSSLLTIPLRLLGNFCILLLDLLDRMLRRFTHYTIYYTVMFPDITSGFLQSGNTVARIFRQNTTIWLLLMTTDSLSRGVFFLSSILLAALFSWLVYLYDTTRLHSIFALEACMIFGIAAFFSLQFIGGILHDALDCALLCHVLLDHQLSNSSPTQSSIAISRLLLEIERAESNVQNDAEPVTLQADVKSKAPPQLNLIHDPDPPSDNMMYSISLDFTNDEANRPSILLPAYREMRELSS
jgi:hypothetical protein